ncbi:hypothetical protein OCH239_18580 [Roseivivax halodurans JCM 10272]|uniref:OmpR/PhoB-type domain-containing protein n=1 Tax=Roseivivax halodurans JCM 10272 TaxID=1449350 RepID=X7E7U3_9RHOB|nr:winged helix-turn-helix domain-containing protein [Roseivivax halodurans]ETX12022.1 hypothetical protein OCH239_18580 [Roseivivax halodurans JCM 10272]
MDLATGDVCAADGAVTELRPKAAALLRALATRPGAVIAKDALLSEVWPGRFVDEDGIVQCVGEIRRALGPDGRDAIRTHHKRGYSLQIAAPNPVGPAGSDDAEPDARFRSRSRWRFAVAAVGLALLAPLGLLWPEPVPATMARGAAAVAYDGPAVAVLHFEALSEGARWERLAGALTQEVIADLGMNGWLFVFGEATSRMLAAQDPGAARRLGAGYLVTGSVQAEGETARVTAMLSDTVTGRQLWTKRFEGPLEDLLRLQREASEAITGELAANWTGPIAREVKAHARAGADVDLTAFELYLAAGERMQTYTPEALSEAEVMLKRAVAMEPGFGEAWAKLSLVSYNRVDTEMSATEMEALWAQGHAAGSEAARVAPDRPFALGQGANAVRWDDPEEAERMVRRAAALAPSNADMLAYLSFRSAHYPALGPEAVEWSDRAIALNPARPDWYDWNRGAALMVVGRFAEAADAYARAPGHIEARAGHLAALALSGEEEAARTGMAALLAEAPHFTARWYADAAGLHADVAEIFARGFQIAGAPT